MSSPGVTIFAEKKAPAASWIAATGLVKSRGGHFHRKKAPAASWLASTGLVKSRGGHFHRKKSACGKLDSSNRACQVRSVPCQVGSVSCRVKSGPCQPPSVSCRVKPHPCQSVPCRVLSDPCVSAGPPVGGPSRVHLAILQHLQIGWKHVHDQEMNHANNYKY